MTETEHDRLVKQIKMIISAGLTLRSPSQEAHSVEVLSRAVRGSRTKAIELVKSYVKKNKLGQRPENVEFFVRMCDDPEFGAAFDNAVAEMTDGTEYEWVTESTVAPRTQELFLKALLKETKR